MDLEPSNMERNNVMAVKEKDTLLLVMIDRKMNTHSKDKGFVQLHRKLLDWEWYDDHNTFRLFITCLLLANWREKKWRGETIARGSFITSQPHLAQITGLSVQNIRTSLDRLKSTGELTVKTTSKYSLVTVSNYENYQKVTGELTVKQQATNRQLTTTNKGNNSNNLSKDKGSTQSSFGDKKINYVLEAYKKHMGFSPTDKYPRRVAHNVSQLITSFIKRNKEYREFTFREVVDKCFTWYVKRDELPGETLDVFKRKMKIVLERTEEELKGGAQNDK